MGGMGRLPCALVIQNGGHAFWVFSLHCLCFSFVAMAAIAVCSLGLFCFCPVLLSVAAAAQWGEEWWEKWQRMQLYIRWREPGDGVWMLEVLQLQLAGEFFSLYYFWGSLEGRRLQSINWRRILPAERSSNPTYSPLPPTSHHHPSETSHPLVHIPAAPAFAFISFWLEDKNCIRWCHHRLASFVKKYEPARVIPIPFRVR